MKSSEQVFLFFVPDGVLQADLPCPVAHPRAVTELCKSAVLKNWKRLFQKHFTN